MSYRLTPAEKNCIDLVRAGLSNQVIADRLSISDRTVKTHLCRAYKKLGVKSRLECVVLLGINRRLA